MKKLIRTAVFLLLVCSSTGLVAEENSADVDQEMIEELDLNYDQALAYMAIMQKQRQVFLAMKTQQWQQQLAFYRETFALLKPVLNEKQYLAFVGIINSVIEDPENEELLVNESQTGSIALSENTSMAPMPQNTGRNYR